MLGPSLLNTSIVGLLLYFLFRWHIELTATITQVYWSSSFIMSPVDDPMSQLTLNNRPDPTISRLEALPQELR